jgi:type VI secretion system secreted protein VgrG
MDRQATISVALGTAKLNLERFESVERLSEPFVIVVEGFSADEIDFLPHLGKPVSLDAGDEMDHVRYFHGLLTEAALIKVDISGAHYRLTVKPWFSLLDLNRNYRIFQDKSVVDIAKQVFADAGMKDVEFDKLTGSYKPREYCVQYKESDFNFLSRLFEDEGIYYYFRHEEAAHKLVLCDAKSAHKPEPGYESIRFLPVAGDETSAPDTLSDWNERVSSVSQANVTLRSFDFTKPQGPVEAVSQGAGQHAGDALEVYEYLGDFTDKSEGEARGQARLAASRAPRRLYSGGGDVLGLACGGLFTLTEAGVDRFNQEYLIIGLNHVVEAESHRSGDDRQARRVNVVAIPSDTLFRPPLVAIKPISSGVETATVTGPSGEVIYVDEWGRVKVRFHWDRSPDQPGKTSCWMRVAHHSAGEGFGNVDLPRVGQEVIVDFLNGDPDRPIITGRVYNGQRKHAYDLPAQKTRSLWRTQTVGLQGDYGGAEKTPPPNSKGFNEIRLEDKGGSEEIYIHAQREMVRDVLLDDTLTVQRDRATRVGRDRATAIKRHETTTIETGNETHEVSSGKRTTTIELDDGTTVRSGNYTVTVDKGSVTIEAAQSITLRVGSSSIVMDPSSITLNALSITSTAKVGNVMNGTTAEVHGKATTTITGGVVKIN